MLKVPRSSQPFVHQQGSGKFNLKRAQIWMVIIQALKFTDEVPFRTPSIILALMRGGGLESEIMYARIWTAQVSTFRSTVCIGFQTPPPSVLTLMEGGGSGMEFHSSRPPICTWHKYPSPKSSPPAMCPFHPVTSTSAPPSIHCLLSPYHFHESTPFPPPHLHHTGTYNILVDYATSSTSHPKTVLDPKRAVIAVVGGG
jgi:hypothetical protein